MYKADDQISLMEFMSPFGELDQNNRWVKIAKLISWRKYEQKYAERFCENNGAPAIKFRMVVGTLIIKQKTGHSDEDTLQDIMENPYMQFLIGLHEFTKTAPFASSSITNFRKYVTTEMIKEINEELFQAENEKATDDASNSGGGEPADEGKDNQNEDQPAEEENAGRSTAYTCR